MDKGCLNDVIFLDLKNAFDCVDHMLIKKMDYYGDLHHKGTCTKIVSIDPKIELRESVIKMVNKSKTIGTITE